MMYKHITLLMFDAFKDSEDVFPSMLEILAGAYRQSQSANNPSQLEEVLDAMINGYKDGLKER